MDTQTYTLKDVKRAFQVGYNKGDIACGFGLNTEKDVHLSWIEYFEFGLEKEPVMGWSVSQKEAIRMQLEATFEKWNKWKPFIPETVETIGEYEDGEPIIVCVGQGISEDSLREKEVMINETLEAIEALTRKEEQ